MQVSGSHLSFEDYFSLDQAAPQGVRLEYLDGTVYIDGQPYDPDSGWEQALSMAGATPAHNRIKTNLTLLIGNQLHHRDCDVFSSDQYTQYVTGRYLYPDLVVSCDPEFENLMLVNPQLIIEILSRGSVDFDTGKKMEAYMSIKSLKEYWIVWQTEMRLQQYYRDNPWGFRHYVKPEQNVTSESMGLSLPLQEIYRRVFE